MIPRIVLLFILFLLTKCQPSFATYRMVSVNGVGGYATIQSAINASAPEDTIYINSGQYYENLTLNQGITIIGFKSVNDAFKTHIIGNHTINGFGVNICNAVFSGNNAASHTIFDLYGDVRFICCNMYTESNCWYCFTINNNANLICEGCYLRINGSYGYPGYNTFLMTSPGYYNMIVKNCKIIGSGSSYSIISSSVGQLIIENSIIYGIYLTSNSSSTTITTVRNSLILSSNIAENSSTTYRYCAKNNAWSTSQPTCIVVESPFDSNYHPTSGSPLLDAGDPSSPLDLDGTRADIGCYGGQSPYNDLGYANWYPHLDLMLVQPSIQEQGGELHIEAAGAIGPTWLGASPVSISGESPTMDSQAVDTINTEQR